MAFDKAALLAKVKETGENMTQAKSFEGGEPYPEGKHRARFVGYIEVGKQKAKYQGKDKIENQVVLIFELSGAKIKAREDGKPNLFTLPRMNKSLSDKAGFFKLFQRMNYQGKATHMAELLGEAYLIELFHRVVEKDGQKRTYVDMKKKGEPIAVFPPRVDSVNAESGEITQVVLPVDAPKSSELLFLWDYADLDQWGSIFIDGVFEEKKDETGKVIKPARSKNIWQNAIRLAENFKGSPIYTALAAAGGSLDIPDAEAGRGDDEVPADDEETLKVAGQQPASTPTGTAADDALAGVV